MYINTQTLTRHTESEIRVLYPNTSFPVPFVPPEDYAWVFPVPPPEYDKVLQSVRQVTPVLTQLGTWQEAWEILPRFVEYTDEGNILHTVAEQEAAAIVLAQEEETSRLATIEAARIASLWQAAHDYEYAQVSGSAIGLLAIGVLQSLPKCLAVQNWIKGIWTEYYTRKAGTSEDTNFSIAGECPHSVPELMIELGL